MIIAVSLVLVLLLVSLGTYIYTEVTYNKFKKIKIKSNLSGFEVSRNILDNYDLNNVYITETSEYLFSRYDSDRKVIRLVKDVFNAENLTSTGISSIEAGYAVLDKKNNKMYSFRKKIVPFVNLLLFASYIIILIGIIFGHINTLLSGIIIDYLILFFYIATYSIDKEAEKIATEELIKNKIITKKELINVQKILKVTTFNNIVSIIFPIVELIKKIVEFGKSN